MIIRNWKQIDIFWGSEEGVFIPLWPLSPIWWCLWHFQEQTPFIFNIGLYLVLAVCCLACPLKTYIRKKTKLIPLKVSKIYFFDQKKEHQIVSEFNKTRYIWFGNDYLIISGSGQSYSPSLLDRENSINQSGKLDYGKEGFRTFSILILTHYFAKMARRQCFCLIQK